MPTDSALVGRILRDPRVIFWYPKPLSKKIMRERIHHSQHLNKKGLGWWLVFTREAPHELVGDLLLQPLSGTCEIEIGYHMLREQWGHGYASEAAHRLLQHAFDTLALKRVCAVVLPRNRRSLRVVEKINMAQSGTHLHGGLIHRYFVLKQQDYASTQNT